MSSSASKLVVSVPQNAAAQADPVIVVADSGAVVAKATSQ